jgi:multiple sugar transport system substrate-binding protein
VAVEVWYHAGQPTERATLEAQASRFNAEQGSIRVDLRFLPEGSYNAQVQASAVAGQLPDLLDLDGPYVAAYAWQGHLAPLAGLLSDSLVADLLPSVVEQGTWRGTLYAIGTFDSGLALYARRGDLEAVGARVPGGPAEAWTAAELEETLERLAARDPDGAVLDLKLNYQGEWFTFAFQPALRSAGGGLVSGEAANLHAGGVLNGDASLGAASALRSWMARGLVDGNLDDAAFTSGRVALSWSGHWDFPRYEEAVGDQLLVLPLPDFGRGTRTGQGSWVWTVPATSRHPRAAAAFLSFLLRPEEVLAMASSNGAVPATRTAADRSALYGPDGPLHLIRRQLEEGWAVPRPRTPAYPFISSVFQDAFDALRSGEPTGPVLGEAAAAIDREIRDNRSYPPS